MAIAAADLTGSGFPDLVVADSDAPSDLDGDGINDYRVDVFLNNEDGTGNSAPPRPRSGSATSAAPVYRPRPAWPWASLPSPP